MEAHGEKSPRAAHCDPRTSIVPQPSKGFSLGCGGMTGKRQASFLAVRGSLSAKETDLPRCITHQKLSRLVYLYL